jgi:tRNA 2-thiocytidine biosynthesis protein TtcA
MGDERGEVDHQKTSVIGEEKVAIWGSGLGRRLESACRKALYDFHMIDGPVAIALSGGKDSLTLLHLLHKIRGHGFPLFDLHAIHVGGEFSCGAGVDNAYLKALCNSLDINYTECTSTQTLDSLECYSCSRERRKLIFDAAKSQGVTTIAFGHHRDDSVETLLLNLLHKAEFAANLPNLTMHTYGVRIIRPLIYLAEEDIRRFAIQQGFARITCQCPVGARSRRRQVKELLHQVEELFPNARANLARAGLLYGSDKAAQWSAGMLSSPAGRAASGCRPCQRSSEGDK